jgi:hypothetical protein
MKNNDLVQKVKSLGFPLLEKEEVVDVNATLADVVKSGDLRLWEGFPVMLAHSVRERLFDYEEVAKHLKSPVERKTFAELVGIAKALFESEGYDVKGFDKAVANVKKSETFNVGGRKLSFERLRNTFLNYTAVDEKAVSDFVQLKGDFDLAYALLQLLSPKQKDLFFKKLKREKMTKTEREYYSRVVRKKVSALANPELHRLAQQVALAD